MARRNYGFSWTIARIKARPVRFQYGLSSTFQSLLGLNFSTGYTLSHIHFCKIKSLVIVMIMMHKLFRYILCYIGCIFFPFLSQSHIIIKIIFIPFFFINIRILLSSTGNNILVKMISDIFLRRITHFLIIVAEDLLVVVITY